MGQEGTRGCEARGSRRNRPRRNQDRMAVAPRPPATLSRLGVALGVGMILGIVLRPAALPCMTEGTRTGDARAGNATLLLLTATTVHPVVQVPQGRVPGVIGLRAPRATGDPGPREGSQAAGLAATAAQAGHCGGAGGQQPAWGGQGVAGCCLEPGTEVQDYRQAGQ